MNAHLEYSLPTSSKNPVAYHDSAHGATTSTASTSTSVVPASKSKARLRIVHPAYDALGACDTCRYKRVKCVRLRAEDPTCENCRTRRLVCTNKQNGGVRYKRRAGKKPEAPPPSPPIQHADPVVGSSATASAAYSAFSTAVTPNVSHSSAENRLSVMEESQTLMAQLMDCSFTTFLGPLGRWSHLRTRFEDAGRRPNMLDQNTEIIAVACIALGALQSDHPLLIGSDAPRLQNLKALNASKDLSWYARQRAPFCQRLTDRVISMVDHRGLFRKADIQSVTAMLFAQRLLIHRDGGESELVRPYLGASIDLVRQMREDATVPDMINESVAFLLFTRDITRAALTGVSFRIPEEEIPTFLHPHRPAPPKLNIGHLQLIQDAVSTDPHDFKRPLVIFWYSSVKQIRQFAADVSIPLRRNRNVKASDFARYLTEAESLFEIYRAASRVASQLQPRVPASTIEIQILHLGFPVLVFLESIALLSCPFLHVFSRQFKAWSLARSAFTVEGQGFSEEMMEVAAIEQNLSRMMVDAVLLVKEALDKHSDALQSWPRHLNWHGVQYNMDAWASIAVTTDCAEDGGPQRYSRAVKLSACRKLIDTVHAQSWMWEHRRDQAAQLELLYHQMEMQATAVAAPTISPATHIPAHHDAHVTSMPLSDQGYNTFACDRTESDFYHPQDPTATYNYGSPHFSYAPTSSDPRLNGHLPVEDQQSRSGVVMWPRQPEEWQPLFNVVSGDQNAFQ